MRKMPLSYSTSAFTNRGVEQDPAIADSVVMTVGLMSVWLDTTSISKVRKTSGQAMTNSDQVTGIDKKYVQWLGFRKQMATRILFH